MKHGVGFIPRKFIHKLMKQRLEASHVEPLALIEFLQSQCVFTNIAQ